MMKKKYFRCRDRSFYTGHTKEEIYALIDPYDFNTILPFLKILDYPPNKKAYEMALQVCQEQNLPPYKALQRFINVMNLRGYRAFGYENFPFLI